MDTQDWKIVEEKLKGIFSPVKLNCDGYKVTLAVVKISDFKLGISPYINGVFKGEWLLNDCEERRRFLRPISKSLHSKKHKESLKKISKKRLKTIGIDLDAKYISYSSYWTTFKSLKSHLIKNNDVIELVQENEHMEDEEVRES